MKNQTEIQSIISTLQTGQMIQIHYIRFGRHKTRMGYFYNAGNKSICTCIGTNDGRFEDSILIQIDNITDIKILKEQP